MADTVVKPQPSFVNELKELKQLEALIAKKISPQLLDYMFLFAPDVSYDIKIKDIKPEGENLLRSYIKAAENFERKLGLDIDKPEGTMLETFLQRLHDMYYMRYIDARTIYAEYEFFRIPTQFEVELTDRSMGMYKVPDESISLILPNVLKLDETNGIDWKSTREFESKEYSIARYISAYKNAKYQTDQMFNDLEAITTRGFAFIIIEKELKEVINEVLTRIYYFFAGEVFKYINRNYLLEESVQNVYEFYKPYADKGKAVFMKTLKPLFDDIHVVINTAFDGVKEMNKTTRSMLIDDFDELIRAYFIHKLVFPKDYYEMIVRSPKEFYESEKGQNYEMITDFHLRIPEGGITEVAFETFHVDFSDEAKLMIFKSVVGDLENPIFTFKNYTRQS